MRKESLDRKLNYLSARLHKDMDERIRKVLDSGCIDVAAAQDDYTLPCNIFAAILKAEVDNHMPISKGGRKEVENIYLFT